MLIAVARFQILGKFTMFIVHFFPSGKETIDGDRMSTFRIKMHSIQIADEGRFPFQTELKYESVWPPCQFLILIIHSCEMSRI